MVVGFALVAAFFFGSAALTYAQSNPIILPNPLTGCQGSNANLICVVGKVKTLFVDIATPAVAVMALIGGFQMMLSSGNPETFKKGQKTIMYAVIGFAVLFLADGFVLIIQNFIGQ